MKIEKGIFIKQHTSRRLAKRFVELVERICNARRKFADHEIAMFIDVISLLYTADIITPEQKEALIFTISYAERDPEEKKTLTI